MSGLRQALARVSFRLSDYFLGIGLRLAEHESDRTRFHGRVRFAGNRRDADDLLFVLGGEGEP